MTRKDRAAKLYERLKTGPMFSANLAGAAFTPEEARRQYQRWADSWVLDDLCDLIKELRETKA